MKPIWLLEAEQYLGVREIPGLRHQSLILGWWRAIKRGGIKSDEVPWCAAFVGAMLEAAGIVSSRYESARSYLAWGVTLRSPALGCVVVFARNGGGHVGFVVGEESPGGRLMVLGGNQGNAVTIAPFDRARVVGYVWPTAVPVPHGVLPILRSGQSSSNNES